MMNVDKEEGHSAERYCRSRWGRVRWSSNLQNLRVELDSVQGQIGKLEEVGGLDESGKVILSRCGKYLAEAESAFEKLFPRELFVWQMLFLIQQNLLLIVPEDELGARWNSLERRLKKNANAAGKCSCDKKFMRDIRQRLKDRKLQSDEEDRDLRNRIMQVRKSLDDPVVLELWRNLQIRRYTMAFLMLGVVLIISLLAFVMLSPTFRIHDCSSGNDGFCAAVGTTLAGAFGAALSALAPGKPFIAVGVPFLTVVSAVRPVIGAAAGLFLYLIFKAGVLDMNIVQLHVLAVGFGFSERAVFHLLGGIAGKSDLAIGSRFG